MRVSEEWREALSDPGVTTLPRGQQCCCVWSVVFVALSHGDRLANTVIGDAVGFAAKLEKHNKIEGTRALVTALTFDLAVLQGYAHADGTRRRLRACASGVAEPIDLIVLSAGR